VYYDKLQPPLPGDHFSAEWGLMNVGDSDAATGWDEYRPDDVRAAIFKLAGDPDLSSYQDSSRRARHLFQEKKEELLSILQTVTNEKKEDAFGFTRAIVVLEEGCQEFSNIHGLGQIRFPKGRIAAAFEEIRKVLEREGLLDE
jgi:hypothetical protein